MRFCYVGLALDRSIGVEGRELFQIYNILPLLRVALSKNCHASGDLAARLMDQFFQRVQALTGRNHVVDDENLLAPSFSPRPRPTDKGPDRAAS